MKTIRYHFILEWFELSSRHECGIKRRFWMWITLPHYLLSLDIFKVLATAIDGNSASQVLHKQDCNWLFYRYSILDFVFCFLNCNEFGEGIFGLMGKLWKYHSSYTSLLILQLTNFSSMFLAAVKINFSFLKTLADCFTFGTGNSPGTEGPSIETGGSVAKGIASVFDQHNSNQTGLSLLAAGSLLVCFSHLSLSQILHPSWRISNTAVAGCFLLWRQCCGYPQLIHQPQTQNLVVVLNLLLRSLNMTSPPRVASRKKWIQLLVFT